MAASKFTTLQEFPNFESLFEYVGKQYEGVSGLGPLAHYDAARRYGLMTRKEQHPKKIYLHRGVIEGARKLGIPVRGKRWIDREELPAELHSILSPLTEDEIEVFLCIRKDRFEHISIAG